MIKFKQFIEPKFIGWKSAFSEMRSKIADDDSKPPKMLGWIEPTKHNDKELKEATAQKMPGDYDDTSEYEESEKGISHPHTIHESDEVKPKKLTRDHKTAIRRYCSSSSKTNVDSSGNMNSYLRHRGGDDDAYSRYRQGTHQSNCKDHEDAIHKLSSAFTPENTNKKEINTYCGVPKHIGEKLLASRKNSKHVFSGFTSTSTKKRTARSFAKDYDSIEQTGQHHILHCKIETGAGLSTVDHSKFNENEILLNHGSHVTYHGSEVHHNSDGTKTFVHHVTIHNKRTPLDKYPQQYLQKHIDFAKKYVENNK